MAKNNPNPGVSPDMAAAQAQFQDAQAKYLQAFENVWKVMLAQMEEANKQAASAQNTCQAIWIEAQEEASKKAQPNQPAGKPPKG